MRRAGSGPALVLAHSALADSGSWQPQLDGLSDAFTVVAWDEPHAEPHWELEDFAAAFAAVVEEVGAPAHVGGISWGGMIALEVAATRPELVRSLVLADTYAGWTGSLPEPEWRARVADPAAGGPLFASQPGPRVEAGAQDTAVLLRCVQTDLRDRLARVAAPTLLVWGEEDQRSPLAVAHQFRDAIPEAELVVLEGAGHLSNLERPDAFNAAVRAFCR